VTRETAERCTIFRGLVGSTVHGLNVNDGIEDRDEMGIRVEPLEDAMALWDPFEQFIYEQLPNANSNGARVLSTVPRIPYRSDVRQKRFVARRTPRLEGLLGRRTAAH
jgi:hypothetical protein